MTSAEFCTMLKSHGLNLSTGVPCSILKDIILHLSSHPDIPYVPATREDEAMGIASGAWLAGRRPVVLMQNSGLASAINPLASLNILYKIPVLLLIAWRGYQGKDAPEHLIMGRVMTKLLEDVGVPVQIISREEPEAAISTSIRSMEEAQTPAAAILRAGVVE